MSKFHFVIGTTGFRTAFRDRSDFAGAWWAMRRAFTQVLASVLMPDHLHLAIETDEPRKAGDRLSIVLGMWSQRFRGRSIWAPAKEPELIANDQHSLRLIRYIHLNPCRNSLVRDPLEWEWSTHRDAVGAARPAWMDLRGIEPTRFHRYVSGDPSVNVASTPLPVSKLSLVATLDEVRGAVLLAAHALGLTRAQACQPRKVFVHLARRLGCTQTKVLAEFLSVDLKTIWNLSNARLTPMEAQQLDASLLILSDPRLNSLKSGVPGPGVGRPQG